MTLVMFAFPCTVRAQTEISSDETAQTEENDWNALLKELINVACSSFECTEYEMVHSVADLTEKEKESLIYLSNVLEVSADHLMRNGEDVDDIYTTLDWKSAADTFPVKFDLRERGTVTPVKSQEPWGTCWSFATIAASETSILNSLGLTAEGYKEKYGEEMDLSEKHLAWFTANALPETDAYPEGEYPFDENKPVKDFMPWKVKRDISMIWEAIIRWQLPALLPVSGS